MADAADENRAGTVRHTPGPAGAVPANPPGRTAGRAEWVVLGAVLLLIAFVRLRLLSLPLERDEGEFAYGGQLLLRGVPPYVQAYAMKLPGIYAVYALLLAVFGQSLAGVRLGVLAVHLVSTLLLFLLARRVLGGVGAAVAVVVWGVASLSPETLGMAGHATHFVVAFALGGFLVLERAAEPRPLPYLAAGLLLGVAVTMKQSGAALAAFGAVLTAMRVWERRPGLPHLSRAVGPFVLGALLPTGIAYALLYLAGVWEAAYFWNFTYAREYASAVPLSQGADVLRQRVGGWSLAYGAIWLCALAGLTTPLWSRATRSKPAALAGGLFLFGCLAVIPGLYFRQHYFLQALPGVALACGLLAVGLADRLPQGTRPGSAATRLAPGLVALPALALLATHGRYFFAASPTDACRMTYSLNPFPESLPVADYLRRNAAPGERVLVLGSEPQIFFYSGRDSATGHVYMYPLMEPQRYARAMQEQLIAEVEKARPRYVVLVSNPASWLEGPWSDVRLREWIAEYRKGFEVVGVAEQVRRGDGPFETRYAWDEEARAYRPESPSFVAVLRRRESP